MVPDANAINTAAQTAQQVGLLQYLVVAITLFCGTIVFYVMYTNNKREERLAKLIEKDIADLGTKIEASNQILKESMGVLAEANRFQKQEHQSMIASLQQTTQTLIALSVALKLPIELPRIVHEH